MLKRTSRARLVAVSFAVWCIYLSSAADVSAQAWVPSGGEGTVTITYQNYYHTGHYDREGRKNRNGATHSKAVIAELNYGLTDTIGLTIGLPFIASKYTGPRPSYLVGPFETFPGPLDDGSYRAAFQDLRVEVRRAFAMGPVAVTPFLGAVFPTHEYETVGEAVPGRHRRQLEFGTNAGMLLDRIVPGAYVHMRYAYTTAEREHDLPYRHSNVDLEGGHLLTSRVAMRALASWQTAHDAPTIDQLAPIWTIHDRFIVSNHFRLGGGVSLTLTPSAEIHALWIATISGRRGAHVGRSLSVGTSWSFGGGLKGLTASATPTEPTDRIMKRRQKEN